MIKRNTIQRQLVIDTVMQLANHPTADEVYNSIIMTHPSISKGTVYRNLNSLVEDGLLQRLQVANSADRFDHTLIPHYHIKCIECGFFMDLDIPYIHELDSRVEQASGFSLINQDILFRGICPECKK